MPETLTVEILVEQLRRLRIAFPSHKGMTTPEQTIETAEVYLEGLHGLSGESIRYAVKQVIETEKFFPKVADLRIHAAEWERRHTTHVEREAAWERCPVCGGRIEWLGLWAPQVDARWMPVTRVVEGVEYLQLTTTARYRCERCAAPSVFAPEPQATLDALGLEGPWMRRDRITCSFGAAMSARVPRRIGTAAVRGLLANPSTDPHAPEQIGDLAENLATRALEHV